MKFTLENIGPVVSASIDLAPLTIVCGKNNSGKTYITNAISEFYSLIPQQCSLNIKEEVTAETEEVRIDLAKYRERLLSGVKDLEGRFGKLSDALRGGSMSVDVCLDDFQIDLPSQQSTWTMQTGGGVKFSARKEGTELVISKLHSVRDGAVLDGTTSVGQWQAVINSVVNAYVFRPIYNGGAIGDVFFVTSERMGVVYFRDALDIAMRARAQDENEVPRAIAQEVIPSDKLLSEKKKLFPRSIVKMMDLVSWVGQRKKTDTIKLSKIGSGLEKDLAELVGGEYSMSAGDIVFTPNSEKDVKVGVQDSSSSVRALLALDFYVRYAAERGDLLVIDEPEMNLHPEKQCQFARFIAKLVNKGIRVFLTTHSDYIVRMINILMTLKNANAGDSRTQSLMEKFGYEKSELLDPEKVSGYKIECGVLDKMRQSREYGIEVASFDQTIKMLNDQQAEILWGRDDGGNDT